MRAAGMSIVSSWIDEDGPGATASFEDLWRNIDMEIRACRRLVLYAEADDFPLKGALVEVGMALGRGKSALTVLPGVTLEPRSMRPLGSWAAHPLVRVVHCWPPELAKYAAAAQAACSEP
ncbi:MAG: hypothetical protein Q8S13_01335 [Dehalococcoidia bacterium]|nr:hypothetical protein [Dehalococcoidia bacterium]